MNFLGFCEKVIGKLRVFNLGVDAGNAKTETCSDMVTYGKIDLGTPGHVHLDKVVWAVETLEWPKCVVQIVGGQIPNSPKAIRFVVCTTRPSFSTSRLSASAVDIRACLCFQSSVLIFERQNISRTTSSLCKRTLSKYHSYHQK